MVSHTRLIVLNVTPLRDSTRVLHTLSSNWGRRSFIVPSAKGGALYQPLMVLDAEVLESPKTDLWRIRNVEAEYPLAGIRGNIYKNAISLFMSEVVYRTITDSSMEPGLFEWLEKSILLLDALEGNFANYHLVWLLEFCSALGFKPSLEDLAPFAERRLEDFRTLLEQPFSQAMLTSLSGERRSEMCSMLLDYISAHTETRIEARSLAVLGELFVN